MLGLGLMPRPRLRGVGAQSPSDNALARSVRQALRGDDDLRTVEVTVAEGEATLTGRVPTL